MRIRIYFAYIVLVMVVSLIWLLMPSDSSGPDEISISIRSQASHPATSVTVTQAPISVAPIPGYRNISVVWWDNDAPTTGASLIILTDAVDGETSRMLTRGVTDEGGEFQFAAPENITSLQVVATHDHGQTTTKTVEANINPIKVRMRRTYMVHGTVYCQDERGLLRPVEGATVGIMGPDELPSNRDISVSDDTGKYQLRNVLQNSIFLYAFHEDMTTDPNQSSLQPLIHENNNGPYNLVMVQPASLLVTVYDHKTNAPIESANVILSRGLEPLQSAFTDQEGFCRFDELQAGTYILKCSAEGHSTVQTLTYITPSNEENIAVILLQAAGSLTVETAFLEDGLPAPNMPVFLSVSSYPPFLKKLRTDDDGKGVFTHVPLEGACRVAALFSDRDSFYIIPWETPVPWGTPVHFGDDATTSAKLYVSKNHYESRPQGSPSSEIPPHLRQPPMWFKGRVIDTEGYPIEGAHVKANYGTDYQPERITDADGYFEFDNGIMPKKDIWIWRKGYRTLCIDTNNPDLWRHLFIGTDNPYMRDHPSGTPYVFQPYEFQMERQESSPVLLQAIDKTTGQPIKMYRVLLSGSGNNGAEANILHTEGVWAFSDEGTICLPQMRIGEQYKVAFAADGYLFDQTYLTIDPEQTSYSQTLPGGKSRYHQITIPPFWPHKVTFQLQPGTGEVMTILN